LENITKILDIFFTWVIEHPVWISMLLPVIVLFFQIFLKAPEVLDGLKPIKGLRFTKRFCGGLALAYFSVSGLFSTTNPEFHLFFKVSSIILFSIFLILILIEIIRRHLYLKRKSGS